MKPYSEASERNREPILAVLKRVLADSTVVLEIGSGTGQHAASFAPELPHLRWQASDVAQHLAGIRLWGVEPIELDVDKGWPAIDADAAFSFLPLPPVPLRGRPDLGEQRALRCLPRSRDPASSVRDFEHVRALAARCGLAVIEDNAMPANNRLLVFRKEN